MAERDVWFALGRNAEARSCRDAAHKRTRLGEQGIPLWDELKSFFGVVRRPDGGGQYVVVHCRGDRLLDLERVAAAIRSSGPPDRLSRDELVKLGLDYGLVNPFETWGLDAQLFATTVLQVFDRDLLEPIGVPGTVMTNAGSLTWSVELRIDELYDALDHTIIADVSYPDPAEPARPPWATSPPTFGIITGNGPDSGMLLWRMLNARVRDALGDKARGDASMPHVLVQSLPELGLSMELDRRHAPVWEALRTATSELCRDGARVIALACNTTPHFAPDIRRICHEYDAEFVSMPEIVGEWLRARGIDRIALLGVKTVAELGPWSPYRDALRGIEVEVPRDAAMAKIHEIAYEVKATGATHRTLNRFRNVLREEVSASVVVLALTELSVLLELQKGKQRSERLIVDALGVYSDALAERYVGAQSANLAGLPQT